MTLLTATVQAMVASGCSPEQIAAVVAAHDAEAASKEQARRAQGAERQRRWRERHPDLVTQRNVMSRMSRVTPRKEEKEKGTQKEKEERLPLLDTYVSSPPRSEKQNNFNELVDWFEAQWNGLAAACGLPKIAAMTDTRVAHIRRRADDLVKALHFPDPQSGFTETFNRIRGSPWLRGANGWKADVDWILTERNFLKIHEGNFAKDQRPEHRRR